MHTCVKFWQVWLCGGRPNHDAGRAGTKLVVSILTPAGYGDNVSRADWVTVHLGVHECRGNVSREPESDEITISCIVPEIEASVVPVGGVASGNGLRVATPRIVEYGTPGASPNMVRSTCRGVEFPRPTKVLDNWSGSSTAIVFTPVPKSASKDIVLTSSIPRTCLQHKFPFLHYDVRGISSIYVFL